MASSSSSTSSAKIEVRPQIDDCMQEIALLKEESPEQEQAAKIGTEEKLWIIEDPASVKARFLPFSLAKGSVSPSVFYTGDQFVVCGGAPRVLVINAAKQEVGAYGEYHGWDMNMMGVRKGKEEVIEWIYEDRLPVVEWPVGMYDFVPFSRDGKLKISYPHDIIPGNTSGRSAHALEVELDEEGPPGASPATTSSFWERIPKGLFDYWPCWMGRRNYDDIEMQMSQPMVVTSESSDGNEENAKAYAASLLSASSLSGLAAGATVLGFATSVSGHLLRRVHPPTARIMSKMGFMFFCLGVLEMLRKNLPENLQWISWAASAELLILFLAVEIFF